jgi:hypothetical protein
VPDEFSGNRIVGDFVGADRVDAGGGESGVEALSDSPPEREVDEVVPGEVGECDFSPICQRVSRIEIARFAFLRWTR